MAASNISKNKPTASSSPSHNPPQKGKPFDKAQGKPVGNAQGKPASGSGKQASSMAELMAKQGSNLQILQKGQAITGTIKKLTSQEILMDIGAKGDALVIEYDRQNLENLLSFLKVGDKVTASVISAESEEGFPVVSLRRALDDIIFGKLGDLNQSDEAFEVEITEGTRGGYFAMTPEGIRGFLPNSQIVNEDSQGDLIGSKIKVKILEFDKPNKRVVFSQKALSYIMNPETIGKYIKRDQAVEGEVSAVTPYGLYVSIKVPGLPEGKQIEGFIHISEISYSRIENLAAEFKTGEKIKAQVIEVDNSNKRINLSIKKTLKDAFLDVKNKFKPEDKIKGTVREIRTRGVSLDLGYGITGFISSEKVPSGTTYKVGDEITAEVVEVNDKRRIVVLSPVLKSVPIGYR